MYRNNYKTVLEYVWIGGNGEIRSKTRVMYVSISKTVDVPYWNYDGSSTEQADSNSNTEIILKPCKLFINPLMNDNNSTIVYYLVLCETYDTNFNPLPSNHRNKANKIFDINLELEPWFGLEQEYFMTHMCSNVDVCLEQGRYYCGTQLNSVERKIVEEHLQACLAAKINISGLNAEVAPNQWEFQIGPCEGIESGDHMIIARFLLERIAEKYSVKINYTPKLRNDINGSGCHTNFSTVLTRSDNGIEEIYNCMEKLEKKHTEHIEVYGKNNDQRLTGIHETSSISKFSYGVGTRNTSVRIPNQVYDEGYGYFEDRRPAANIDPYQVTSIIFKTCCLDK
jgi:glutamine synthetase